MFNYARHTIAVNMMFLLLPIVIILLLVYRFADLSPAAQLSSLTMTGLMNLKDILLVGVTLLAIYIFASLLFNDEKQLKYRWLDIKLSYYLLVWLLVIPLLGLMYLYDIKVLILPYLIFLNFYCLLVSLFQTVVISKESGVSVSPNWLNVVGIDGVERFNWQLSSVRMLGWMVWAFLLMTLMLLMLFVFGLLFEKTERSMIGNCLKEVGEVHFDYPSEVVFAQQPFDFAKGKGAIATVAAEDLPLISRFVQSQTKDTSVTSWGLRLTPFVMPTANTEQHCWLLRNRILNIKEWVNTNSGDKLARLPLQIHFNGELTAAKSDMDNLRKADIYDPQFYLYFGTQPQAKEVKSNGGG